MSNESIQNHVQLSYLKLFLALSRASHALLDIAAPCLAALLWLDTFPPLRIIILGIGTALAGYLSVYALNDMVDYRLDREKIQTSGLSASHSDVDAVYVRHPLAYGLLSVGEGLLWTGGWALLALIGAYLLNPVCALIFLVSIILEVIYCVMLQVSHLRIIVSGVVKTLGAIAAVCAVDPRPSPAFLIMLFAWLFFWEIGGQNIPNDLTDIEEDISLNAKTVPVRLGPAGARIIILISLTITVMMSMILLGNREGTAGFIYMTVAFLIGLYFLLIPAYRLYKIKTRTPAIILFNRASYYPLAILILVATLIIFLER